MCICSRPCLTHLWDRLNSDERSLDHYISDPQGTDWYMSRLYQMGLIKLDTFYHFLPLSTTLTALLRRVDDLVMAGAPNWWFTSLT